MRVTVRVTQSFLTKTVVRLPSRIVPPRCVVEISGMLITTGCGVSGSISVECASAETVGAKPSDEPARSPFWTTCARGPYRPGPACCVRTR